MVVVFNPTFQQDFNYLMVVSFIGGETRVPGENHQTVTSH